MLSVTPLRSLGTVDPSGLRVLSAPDISYADGAEPRLAEIVGDAHDLSSASVELVGHATDWAETYSLTPTRANLLRALDLRPGMKVLEIGCGNGAVTRYIGESVAAVDAVEPMPARATVARLRTRDLDGVEVYVGTLEDVPREPVYDVVVVVGVLEYVGRGTLDEGPYLDFLERCRDVLVDGGTLVLAIENALGVKYLAGAGEDHTNRPFDSLEGYLLESPARTFSREALRGLARRAGLEPQVLGAFPDYKLPRVLMSDALFDEAPALAARTPRFPSPDWVVPRLQLADEAALWRTLVGAGVGAEFANSFVMLATKGGQQDLWPDDRLAVLLSADRQPAFVVRTEVVREGGAVQIRRTRPLADRPVEADGVRHHPPATEEVHAGDELLQLAVEQPGRRAELLRAWADLVPDAEWAPVDLVPHNVLVRADGSPVVVDQEWSVRDYPRDCLLLRGLVLSATRLAQLTRFEDGEGRRPVSALVGDLAADIGLELTDDLVDRFVAVESRFQGAVNTTDATLEARVRRSAADLHAVLATDVTDLRGGQRLDQLWPREVHERDAIIAEIRAERDRTVAELLAAADQWRLRWEGSLEARLRRMLAPVLRPVARVLRRLGLRR